MKRITKSLVFIAVALIIAFSATIITFAYSTINPLYNNTSSVSSTASISGSGLLTINVQYTGISGTTSKGVITTYVEKKTLGLFWTKVNNGQSSNEWVDTSNSYRYNTSHSLQLSSKGDYRVTVKYKISGSGGTTDNITNQILKTY